MQAANLAMPVLAIPYFAVADRLAIGPVFDDSPREPLPPLPGLPPTPEQLQQARRLAEAGAKELERVKEALQPRKPPAVTKHRAKDPLKAWVRAGRTQPGAAIRGGPIAFRGSG